MTEEVEEQYRNSNICRFCEKNIESDKVRDHCNLISKYRGLAHSICNINLTEKQSIFYTICISNSSDHDFHLFFKDIVVEKMMKKNLKSYLKQTKNKFV